ncbi:hypothetical protein [Paenibacillus sp. 481]|uniref:hypothetical protein n=1 Tax=Paenibacillus sp. 481 TaxID=2835869 RepID=UPI001E59ABC7|nr:hypothetical protein [Paenibacillus sp. 481]UHA74446.1 hypothetical protein KIK04_04885 [Paenibacillus sp. 481]
MGGWQSSNMENYVAPKEFKYVKNEIVNINKWREQHPHVNCFYCAKEREEHEMEFTFSPQQDEERWTDRMSGLGICRLCFQDFRIGNLYTDRYVVKRILAKYKTSSGVVNWFQRNGYEMFGGNEEKESDWISYRFINNPVKYFSFLAESRKKEPLPNGGYLTPDEGLEMHRLLDDDSIISIRKNGEVYIYTYKC